MKLKANTLRFMAIVALPMQAIAGFCQSFPQRTDQLFNQRRLP